MNAPGNTILIIALVAAFVACCGYAAGRVHQRRQAGDDREAAYRDGYEKGSRNVFRLAARVIVPGRPVRAAAPVKPESAAGDETTLLPPMSSRRKPAPSPKEPAPASKEPAPASKEPAPSPTGKDGEVPAGEISELGFPLPPPPPEGTVPEPSAVGGVRFQRFPDPRTGGETTVLPDLRDLAAARPEKADSVPEPRRAPGHRAPEGEEEDTVDSSVESSSAGGRHTVPEELVKAATYRLPADRVFRAKVPGATTAPPDEPTTKLVPKPRQS
jgi:hypothetical protein